MTKLKEMNMPKRELLKTYALPFTISSGPETGYGEVIKECYYKAGKCERRALG